MSCFPTTLPLLRHYQPDLHSPDSVVMRTGDHALSTAGFACSSPFTVVNIKNVRMRDSGGR